ncbi:hypothetical protein [Bradyrhizobium viridifuturi]|uniref:hypothetical protein n=1 Tax=Bradyrhizobium viridifuturi TaxID=1654716 RepID=UPI000B04FF27
MSVACKFERSILNHEEYEAIRLTHHPAIYDVEVAELEAMRPRLRKMRDKERTVGRHKQRESRGKADARGTSFPGTAAHASERKQVFAAALKRVNTELRRQHNLAARTAHVEAARKASRCTGPRTSRPIHRPEPPRAKAWRRSRANAVEKSLQARKSGGCRSRRRSLRPCATRGGHDLNKRT